MLTDRFLNLIEWGFNVPFFICNPCGNYGKDAFSSIKFFSEKHGIRRATLFVSRKDGKRDRKITNLSIQDAYLRAHYLEYAGYEVIFLDNVIPEFKGNATLNEDGTGDYWVTIPGVFGKFGFVEAIEDKKLRHIMRMLLPLRQKTEQDVCVFFLWANEFTGVKHSKLIISDYYLL